MASLHPMAALTALPDMDVELPVDGLARDLDLELLGDVGLFERPAAGGADAWQERLVGFVDLVGRRRLPVGVEDDFRVSSRIVDTSQPHGHGTSLPVARENDFRNNFSIDDVPVGGSARVTLRLYSPVETEQNVTVTVTDVNAVSNARTVTLRPVNGVAYASVDLGAASDVRSHPTTINVTSTGAKVWGVATVTDNTTQEVTAFWPQ